jgi:Tol biopolymer transport system component
MVNLIPARWTPNGRELLFWKDPDFSASLIADGLDLYRISMEGGKPRETMANTLVHSEVLQFSPDGNELALVEGSGRETWREKRLASLEMATGRLRHLTAADRIALSPAWSPDGKWIAFVSAPAAKERSGVVDARRVSMDQRRIWLMRPDGSEAHALTNDPKYRDEYPIWSRDGSRVLFVRVDSAGKASICLIGMDGGRPRRIVTGIEPPSDYYGYTPWAGVVDFWR